MLASSNTIKGTTRSVHLVLHTSQFSVIPFHPLLQALNHLLRGHHPKMPTRKNVEKAITLLERDENKILGLTFGTRYVHPGQYVAKSGKSLQS